MALWKTINELCKMNKKGVKEQVNQIYSTNNFPHKIRSVFATWVETNNWDVHEDTKCETGERLFGLLMEEISLKIKELEAKNFDLEADLDLGTARDSLKKSFQGNYGTFIDVVRRVLQEEQMVVTLCAADDGSELKHKQRQKVQETNSSTFKNMEEKLKLIRGHIHQVSQQQSEMFIELGEKQGKLMNLQVQTTSNPEIDKLKKQLSDDFQKLKNRIFAIRQELYERIVEETTNLLMALEIVWEESNIWLTNKKKEKAGLVYQNENSIESLDSLFRQANDLLLGWMAIFEEGTTHVYNSHLDSRHPELREGLQKCIDEFKNSVLTKHLQHVLVVETKNRILKVTGRKSNSFQIFVRLLGGLYLDQKHKSPKVSVTFLPESDLEKVDFSTTISPSPHGAVPLPMMFDAAGMGLGRKISGVDSATIADQTITKGICEIENGHERSFQEDAGNLSFIARFYNLQLKNLNRFEKPKTNELVTDQKYRFLVQTTITVLDRSYLLKGLSLPIIVTSQTSQETMAKGTLIWHAAFSEDDKKGFLVSERVLWKDFANVLNCLFMKQTERGLLPDHLYYLAKMAFNSKEPKGAGVRMLPLDHFDEMEISYNQIMKQKLPRKEFSLWKWVFACLNLAASLVKEEWKGGYIFGFISKDDAKKKLEGQPRGTFMLRFSETNIDSSQKSDPCGFLTVAVQELDPETGDLKLFHVRDYMSPRDIDEKGLAPILDAMEVADYTNPKQKIQLLKYLWPHNKKLSEVFKPHNSSTDPRDSGSYYKCGKFTIEIFLSERRQVRDTCTDDIQMDSNPSSVRSYMSGDLPYEDTSLSSVTLTNFFGSRFLYESDMIANSPKPTATVQPASHLQCSDFPLPDETFDDNLLYLDNDGDLVMNGSLFEEVQSFHHELEF